MTDKSKPKGGAPGDDYTGKKKYDKDWPPKPKPIKQAKKNKKTGPLTGKSDIPYGQPEKAETNDPNDNKRKYA